MKKMLMYVYSDIKTDARVMRSVEALKENFDITLAAANSDTEQKINKGFKFINVVDDKIKNPLIKYIVSLMRCRKLIKNIKPDIIYGHDYYAAPIIACASKKHRLIYDAHELYIANKNSSKREKLCYFFEKKAIERANQAICASERRKEIMKRYYSTQKDICVINNISILPRIKADVIEEEYFESDNRKIVVYCGALIHARRVDLLVDAAKNLEKDIRVLIIGGGEELDKLKKQVSNFNINNVRFINALPYKYLWSVISKCDIGYLHYENDTLNNSNCAPNKIYEYASAGLVMIANNNLGLNDIFQRYSVGCASNQLEQAIVQAINNYDIYKKNVETFFEKCSWENEEDKLRITLKQL